MHQRQSHHRTLNTILSIALGLALFFGMAALARADWHDATLPRVASDLRTQSQELKLMAEPWALHTKNRLDFAVYKIQQALTSRSPAAENTHLRHACDALKDASTHVTNALNEAQSSPDASESPADRVLEHIFEHMNTLSCRG